MLSFFPRGVLYEILILIVSVSEDFPSYSHRISFLGIRAEVQCIQFSKVFRKARSNDGLQMACMMTANDPEYFRFLV